MTGFRELPPLRVKLVGDNTSYKKMADESKAIAEDLAATINKTMKKAGGGVRGSSTRLDPQIRNMNYLDKLRETDHKRMMGAIKNFNYLDRLKQQEVKRVEQSIQQSLKNLNYIDGLKAAERRRAEQAVQQSLKNLNYLDGLRQQERQRAASSMSQNLRNLDYIQGLKEVERRRQAAAIAQNLRNLDYIQGLKDQETKRQQSVIQQNLKNLNYLDKLRQNSAKQEADKLRQNIKNLNYIDGLKAQEAKRQQASLSRNLRNLNYIDRLKEAERRRQEASIQRNLRNLNYLDGLRRAETQRIQRDRAQAQAVFARRLGIGQGGGTMAGLGDRADIYMHLNAIKGTLAAASSFVAASANWQRMQVQMEGFTGSPFAANQSMERMRKAALESPYDMQTIMGSVKQLMAYGSSVETAEEVTRRLGDVAGGANEKLDRLALGMAQIISLGKLQGNELRQLTEHGFNPLRTIAERTLGPMQTLEQRMQELTKMKEDGLITSEMVIQALRIETEEGGRFAGMSKRMANDVWGLGQQIKELLTQLQKRFTDTLLTDIEIALRAVIKYIKEMDEWMVMNKRTIREWAKTAKDILTYVVALNALGMALAMVRWQARLVIGVLTILPRVALGIYEITTALTLMNGTLGATSVLALRVAGALGIAVAVAAGLGYVLYTTHPDIVEFNRQLEKAQKNLTALRKQHMTRFEATVEAIQTEKDPAAKQKMLNDAIAAGEKELASYNTRLQEQEKLVKSLEPTMWGGYQVGRKTWEVELNNLRDLEALREDQADRIKTLKGMVEPGVKAEFDSQLAGMIDDAKKAAEALNQEMPAIVEPKVSMPKAIEAVKAMPANDAPIYRSAEYAVRVQAARDAMQARRRGDTNMETDVEKRMLQELKKISKNTGAKPAPVQINSANFLGQEVA